MKYELQAKKKKTSDGEAMEFCFVVGRSASDLVCENRSDDFQLTVVCVQWWVLFPSVMNAVSHWKQAFQEVDIMPAIERGDFKVLI